MGKDSDEGWCWLVCTLYVMVSYRGSLRWSKTQVKMEDGSGVGAILVWQSCTGLVFELALWLVGEMMVFDERRRLGSRKMNGEVVWVLLGCEDGGDVVGLFGTMMMLEVP